MIGGSEVEHAFQVGSIRPRFPKSPVRVAVRISKTLHLVSLTLSVSLKTIEWFCSLCHSRQTSSLKVSES